MNLDEAQDWLAAQIGPDLPLPPNFKPGGLGQDPVSMMLLGRVPEHAVDLGGLVCAMLYDTDIHQTSRVVRFRRGWFDGDVCHVTGYCTLRKEPRRFRANKIVQLINFDTGEIIDDPITFFESFGLTRGSDPFKTAIQRAKPGLSVLAAISAIDGVVLDEIEVMLVFLDHVADAIGVRLSDDQFSKVGSALKCFRPEPRDVLNDLRAAHSDPVVGPLLSRAMRDMVVADGRITQQEASALELLMAGLETNHP